MLLVVTTVMAFVLFAFVAESRADVLDVTTDEVVVVLDPDASSTDDPTSPDDGTTTPAPDDGTTTPAPDDGTTTPAPDDGTTTPAPDDGATTPPPTTPLPPEDIPFPPLPDPSDDVGSSIVSTGPPVLPGGAPDGGLVPSDLLRALGGGGGPAGVDNPSGSGTTTDQNSRKSSGAEPTRRFPQPPRPETPFGFSGFGGVFGGSAGGAGGTAMVVLAALFGLFALAQVFGSRLSMRTTPLRGAAPAYQLKRPG
jgi:hypothetical protein